MRYEIERKHDLELGALLIVRFPEKETDYKALYTVENDMPDFLLPFTYRSIDGMMECTYRVGNMVKLQHLFGPCGKGQYVQCWNLVLQPLIECKDWFLNPYSFVLDASELYAGRDMDRVKYLYVPSKTEAGDYEALKSMVMDISRQNTVDDPALENMVLRAIMNEFSPKNFLQILSSAVISEYPAKVQARVQPVTVKEETQENMKSSSEYVSVKSENDREMIKQPDHGFENVAVSKSSNTAGEIQINFPGESQKSVSKQKEKADSGKKKLGGLFGAGKKKQVESSQVFGAPAELMHKEYQQAGSSAARKEDFVDEIDDDGRTVIEIKQSTGLPCLLYSGSLHNMPQKIDVVLSEYGRFTIGRMDRTLGKKQSDFEFAGDTKEVSRRHAVIEKQAGSYVITDLQSTAGTYVNGNKLQPGVPCVLSGEERVSFGHGGADYIWRT